jgi:hypothetical protein
MVDHNYENGQVVQTCGASLAQGCGRTSRAKGSSCTHGKRRESMQEKASRTHDTPEHAQGCCALTPPVQNEPAEIHRLRWRQDMENGTDESEREPWHDTPAADPDPAGQNEPGKAVHAVD